MDVIPLTLAISLLLSLTFIALFVREFTRPRRAGAEHDSRLPLAPEQSVVAQVVDPVAPVPEPAHAHDHHAGHGHDPDEVCISRRTDGRRCGSCRRREERAAARAAANGSDALSA